MKKYISRTEAGDTLDYTNNSTNRLINRVKSTMNNRIDDGEYEKKVFSDHILSQVFAMAYDQIPKESRLLIEQVSDIRRIFANTLLMYSEKDISTRIYPAINANMEDDGSAFLEWIFPLYRFGFCLYEHQQDSSWFFVTKTEMGEQTQSGQIQNEKSPELFSSIMSFVMENT